MYKDPSEFKVRSQIPLNPWSLSVVSDSVRPCRLQPTRLPHPWDSPGKNTGVGCHFLLQCMKVKSESEAAQSCLTLSDLVDCSLPGSSIHWIFQARVLEWGAIEWLINNRNLFLTVLEAMKSKIKALEGLGSDETCFLVCRWPTFPYTLMLWKR